MFVWLRTLSFIDTDRLSGTSAHPVCLAWFRDCFPPNFTRLVGLVLASLFGGLGLAGDVRAQEQTQGTEERLLDQQPFDQITLDEANNGAQIKVHPLPFPGRRRPRNPRADTPLRVILMADEPAEYDIYWRNITRVELYEELLLKEAERLRDATNLNEAFEYYYEIRTKYPHMRQQVEPSINRYLYLDAANLTRTRRFNEALGVVEELYRRDPKFQYRANAPSLVELVGRLVDRVVNGYLERKQYGQARQVLKRIQTDYRKESPASVARWTEQLIELAAKKRDEARQHLAAPRYHEAITAAKAMINIWPDIEGADELYSELSRKYPLVVVGVLQPANEFDAHRIDNWGTRRTGRLVHRSMVEFLGAGPEGGQYQFALGMFERSDDQRRLTLRLDQFPEGAEQPLSGYEISGRLLQMADPSSPQYAPAWGGLVESVSVQDVQQVNIGLRRPHVLPEALLGVALRPREPTTEAAGQGDGPFRVGTRDPLQVQFISKSFQPGARLAEVIERTFENTQQALAALRRGEIDIVDRVFPADAARLSENRSPDSPVAIGRYALPTVHLLLVNPRNVFLANRDFRRALAFGIDRETILSQELLGGRAVSGCRVISGPFPAGASDQDPLAYAYDETIAPRAYAPQLARLLKLIATRNVRDLAASRGDPEPQLEPLVLGHASHEAARVAAGAIAAYLRTIELECQLHEFAPGASQDADTECDLVYAEVAIWEPLVDTRRLFGARGIAPTDNAYVRRALRWLDNAQSWGEVRERLLEVHRTVYNEVSIVPLWQTVDFFAYSRRLRNLGERPVWIYQNIERWRLGAAVLSE